MVTPLKRNTKTRGSCPQIHTGCVLSLQLDGISLVYAIASFSCGFALRCSHPQLLSSQASSPTCQLYPLVHLHLFQPLAPQSHWLVLGFTYSGLFSYTYAHGLSSLWFQPWCWQPDPRVPDAGHLGLRGPYGLMSHCSCWSYT